MQKHHDEQQPEAEQADVSQKAHIHHTEENAVTPPEGHPTTHGKAALYKRFLGLYMVKKWLSIPLTVLVIVGVLAAVPVTRFGIAGLVIKRDYRVTVLDATTNKPVVKATISLGGKTAETDSNGVATVRVTPGAKKLTVNKNYYQAASQNLTVSLSRNGNSRQITLRATGRQVPLSLINNITGKPLADATIQAVGSEAKTDKDGKALLVLPTTSPKQKATVTLGGYNTLSTDVTVTDAVVPENTLSLVPSGRVFFLSNQSGNIDVVSTNLDGSDRKVVLPGTGKEDRSYTTLTASPDWKYLALLSNREGGNNPKLYLLQTDSSKLTVMDEGDATFSPVGWSGHYFVYTVYRNGYSLWQAKAQALKSFDADKNKLTTLDETQASGNSSYNYMRSSFGNVFILGGKVVYGTSWNSSYYYGSNLNGKIASLMSVSPDGSAKRSVKDFPVPDWQSYFSVDVESYRPQAVHLTAGAGDSKFYLYANNTVTALSNYTYQQMYQDMRQYFVSPDGTHTLWYEPRDGKAVFFVGDSNGDGAKQIATSNGQNVYGWYTDNYVLTTKGTGELYIMSAEGGQQVKVTDYYGGSYELYSGPRGH